MNDLIKALQIFAKYANGDHHPTDCDYGEFAVCAGITIDMVSDEDIKALDELGFFWVDSEEYFVSYRFGSC